MDKADDRKNKGVVVNEPKETDDEFPAGISVLIVDDDETSLIWVENLCHTCQFKVTKTLYPRDALDMLRADKTRFDIVITDVQMPEIDGFQLLETIGLEMDIPVIMMSIYKHKEYMIRGVEHGAVDYLVKPVKLEAIQNIWQHVLRKRKGLAKGKKIVNSDDKSSQGAAIGIVGDPILSPGETSSQGAANGIVGDPVVSPGETSSKRRRDPTADDEDHGDEDDSDHEGQTSQRRPRVVWSPDLHRKFVEAVNHLGLDKAVPKKILDYMDNDKLTRENIASHLQKYRIYLKKTSEEKAQLGMPGMLAGRNAQETLNFLGGLYPNSLLSGYPSSASGILGGNYAGISSSHLIQPGQNLGNTLRPNANLQPNGMPSFPNRSLFQGVPGGIAQDSKQAGKTMTHLDEFNPGHGAKGFGVSENFVDPKLTMNSSNKNLMMSGPSQPVVPGAFYIRGMAGSSSAGSVVPQRPNSSFQTGVTFSQNQLPVNSQAMSGFPSIGNQQQQQLVGFSQMSATGVQAASGGVNNAVNIHGTTPQTMRQLTGIMEQANPSQDNFIPNNIESMNDIVNSMTIRDNKDTGSSSMFLEDEEFDFGAYN